MLASRFDTRGDDAAAFAALLDFGFVAFVAFFAFAATFLGAAFLRAFFADALTGVGDGCAVDSSGLAVSGGLAETRSGTGHLSRVGKRVQCG